MKKTLNFLLDVEITDDQTDFGLQTQAGRRAYAYMACGSGGGGGCGGCCGGGRYTEETADEEESGLSIS